MPVNSEGNKAVSRSRRHACDVTPRDRSILTHSETSTACFTTNDKQTADALRVTIMASQQDGSFTQPRTPGGLDHGMVWTAFVLLLVAAAAFGLRPSVSADALAPLVATMLFGLAATIALIGLMLRQNRLRISSKQVAGLLTFVGIGVSIAIEADQITRLLASPDQTD